MGWLRRLFGAEGDPPEDRAGEAGDRRGRAEPDGPGLADDGPGVDLAADRHLVVAWIRLADPTFSDGREQRRVFDLEDRLMRTLYESGEGDLDTDELAPGYFAMRLVGSDADRIVAVAAPLLADAPAGSYLAVRRGPTGTSETRLDLPLGPA